MIVEVRGGLGTQVVQWAVYRAKYGSAITGVRVNVRGVHPFGRVDYLSQLFRDVPRVALVDAAHKLHLRAEHLLIAAEHAAKLPLIRRVEPSGEVLLHVRRDTQQATSDETYERALVAADDYCGGRARVLRDDLGDPVDDWHRVLAADLVYSSVSLFTLSAALVRPDLRVRLLPVDGPTPPPPEALAEVRAAVERLPNVEWWAP